jgi:hypothetical protein
MRRLLYSLSFILLLGGCGLEEYVYLTPIPAGNIRVVLNNHAEIQLFSPSEDQRNYFQHYEIFYRIYISSEIPGAAQISTSEFSGINAALQSDYNAILPYLNSDASSTSIGTLFTNRKYYPLAVAGTSIDGILSADPGASDWMITLDFPSGKEPDFRSSGVGRTYLLRRTGSLTNLEPAGNLSFTNTDGLYSAANATDTINKDVQSNASGANNVYTYVCLYIVAMGINPASFTPIYSIPSFIGVFPLPNGAGG